MDLRKRSESYPSPCQETNSPTLELPTQEEPLDLSVAATKRNQEIKDESSCALMKTNQINERIASMEESRSYEKIILPPRKRKQDFMALMAQASNDAEMSPPAAQNLQPIVMDNPSTESAFSPKIPNTMYSTVGMSPSSAISRYYRPRADPPKGVVCYHPIPMYASRLVRPPAMYPVTLFRPATEIPFSMAATRRRPMVPPYLHSPIPLAMLPGSSHPPTTFRPSSYYPQIIYPTPPVLSSIPREYTTAVSQSFRDSLTHCSTSYASTDSGGYMHLPPPVSSEAISASYSYMSPQSKPYSMEGIGKTSITYSLSKGFPEVDISFRNRREFSDEVDRGMNAETYPEDPDEVDSNTRSVSNGSLNLMSGLEAPRLQETTNIPESLSPNSVPNHFKTDYNLSWEAYYPTSNYVPRSFKPNTIIHHKESKNKKRKVKSEKVSSDDVDIKPSGVGRKKSSSLISSKKSKSSLAKSSIEDDSDLPSRNPKLI